MSLRIRPPSMGDIGGDQHEYEFEPFGEPVQEPVVAPVEPAREPEKVPA